MNKKYMLIEVVEREIYGTKFDTFEEARKAMVEEYEEIVKQGADDCWIIKWGAWVNDGPNHYNYDWKIIEC